MSYAELGKFEEAITWQKKAIDNLPKKENGYDFSDLKERFETRIKLYQNRKPLRFKTADSNDWFF